MVVMTEVLRGICSDPDAKSYFRTRKSSKDGAESKSHAATNISDLKARLLQQVNVQYILQFTSHYYNIL